MSGAQGGAGTGPALRRTVGVTVCCAGPGRAWRTELVLDADRATVGAAIEAAGLQEAVVVQEGARLPVGRNHCPCSLDTPLVEGDLVEVYRPLLVDPMEARRLRAARRKA